MRGSSSGCTVGRPFPKGVSGNPGGRPKGLKSVQDLARAHTTQAMEALVAIMQDENASTSARIAAAVAILDRGWGRPTQAVEHADGRPSLRIVLQPVTRDGRAREQQVLGRYPDGAA